jgi:hypothetical protein
MATVSHLSEYRRRQKAVFFSRAELNQLLGLYSRQVARGEWRDYAIDQHEGAALFSVFRHTQEAPLYRIIKTAAGGGRQSDFALLCGRQRLVSGSGLGDVLAQLLRMLRRPMPLNGGSGQFSRGAPIG